MFKKILLIVSVLILPLVAQSDGVRRVSVDYRLEMAVADSDYPPVIWRGSGPLRYQWENGEGRVIGGDVPVMRQLCPVEVPGYDSLMLVVRGRPGTTAVVKFENGDIVVTGLDLELDVINTRQIIVATMPSPQRPLLHLSFQDLRLSGKPNIETMSAELAFTTVIPRTGDDTVDAAIAGKTVNGTLQIALQNPYQKK